MTNEEQYTIDTTPFRVKIDEPAPGPSGDRLRKWNALNKNIDRQKTIGDIEYDNSTLVEYLSTGSNEKVWAVCIQCGKGRWLRYVAYCHHCHLCGARSTETRKKISDNHADVSGENNPMFGKHHSEETRKKMSDPNRGENHHMYGKHIPEETRIKMSCAHQGITFEEFTGFTHEEHVIFRRSGEYVKWRTVVFERDNYTCQECGVHGNVSIEAHHIIPLHVHREPEYSLNTDNGITLCKMCHDKINGREDEFYNKYTAIVKANSGFKDDFLSSSVILEGLKKQNDLHSTHQPTIFDY